MIPPWSAIGQQKTKAQKGCLVGIKNGDTYDLLLEGKTKIRIRMHGIDAPEKGMPFSSVSMKSKKIAYDYLAEYL